MFSNIAIAARTDFPERKTMLKTITGIIERAGATVCADRADADCLIVLGGDGTILRTVNEMTDFSPPILALNYGTVGFLTECDTEDAEAVIPSLLRGEGHIDERHMLACAVFRPSDHHDGGVSNPGVRSERVIQGHALNEVVVSQGAISRLIRLTTEINGSPLAVFRADGIIIATPTGSTAYNLAAGGPILHPGSCDTIITPINAHTLTQKPLAVPADSEISVQVSHRDSPYENVLIGLTLDGQTHHEIRRGDCVVITKHRDTVKFLRRREDAFYDTLRRKLRWGE